MWRNQLDSIPALSFLQVDKSTRSVQHNLQRIMDEDLAELPILTVFEYQWYVMTKLIKHIHLRKRKDEQLFVLLKYIKKSCDFLVRTYAEQLRPLPESGRPIEKEEKGPRGVIPRNYYRLCEKRERCDFKYRRHSCARHHYVHNLISEDLSNIMDFLRTGDINDEVLDLLTTVRYVVLHMYEEFRARCSYEDSTMHVRNYV